MEIDSCGGFISLPEEFALYEFVVEYIFSFASTIVSVSQINIMWLCSLFQPAI